MHTMKWFIASFALLASHSAQAYSSAVTPARAVVTEAPHYPTKARKYGIEGVVLLQIKLDKNGQKQQVQVKNPDEVHPILRDAALKSIQNWRFAPAQQNEQPVSFNLTVPMRFELIAQRDEHQYASGLLR